MNAIPRLRAYSGPTLLSYGFRPFFFFGAVYSGLAILIWMPFFFGEIELSTSFSPRDWHAHEMIYGYIPAVIAGFLLTAIPNWTGRLPLQGIPLLVLLTTWTIGRIVVAVSSQSGWLVAAGLDSAFLILLAGAAAREIIYGRNWNNLKVLVPILVLALGNVAFHVEAHFGSADYGIRIGISAIVALLTLIGGRIIPSFTGNWLRRQEAGQMPLPFGRFDMIVVVLSSVALLSWIALPVANITVAALVFAGLFQTIRLARWAGHRTLRDRLVLVLHIAYAFVPLGFLLAGLGAAQMLVPSAGIHAWMAGAAGMMTLAVMTRATLGHTGQPLAASVATQLLYLSIFVAAITRLCAAIEPTHQVLLLCVAAVAWITGFAGFAVLFAPLLWRQRRASA